MNKLKWNNRIVITKDEESRKPIITVEGLWTGRDRMIINRHLVRYMRKAAGEILKLHRQADLKEHIEEVAKAKEESKVFERQPEEINEVSEDLIKSSTMLLKESVEKENIKEEEIKKCPKTKTRTKKKRLLMKKKKG